jgi:hypothetical protein
MHTLYRLVLAGLLSLAPLGAHAATITVRQGGGGDATTINGGIAKMHSGDTLLIGAGTYDEVISDVGGPGSPMRPPSGTPTQYTVIRAERPGTVTLHSRSGSLGAVVEFDRGDTAYIELAGLVMDGEHKQYGTSTLIGLADAHHLRFTDLVLKDAQQGIQGTAYDIEVRNVVTSGHGYDASGNDVCFGGSEPWPGFCHGVYVRGARWTFDNVESHHNSGYGFQVYASDSTVTNSQSHHNYSAGIIMIGGGATVMGNQLTHNRGGGIKISSGTVRCNSIADQSGSESSAIGVQNDNGGATIVQNVLRNLGGGDGSSYIIGGGEVHENYCDRAGHGCTLRSAGASADGAPPGCPAHGPPKRRRPAPTHLVLVVR